MIHFRNSIPNILGVRSVQFLSSHLFVVVHMTLS